MMVVDPVLEGILRSPSRLWVAATGIKPEGDPWDHDDTHCVMCGTSVRRGDLATAAGIDEFGAGFNNKPDVKYRGEAVCGHCITLRSKQWLQAKSKSYAVLGEGLFKLSSNADIARFVLDPPTAPYVAIFNTRQQQHMIWRTPVAMPARGQVIVRVDDDIAVLNTDRVRAGIRAWRTCAVVAASLGKPYWTPFSAGKSMTSDCHVGRERTRIADAMENHSAEGKEAVAALRSLTALEWWAVFASREVDVDLPATWPPRVKLES